MSSFDKSFPIYVSMTEGERYGLIVRQVVVIGFPLVQETVHELGLCIHRLFEFLSTGNADNALALDEEIADNAHLEGELLLVDAQESLIERQEVALCFRQSWRRHDLFASRVAF